MTAENALDSPPIQAPPEDVTLENRHCPLGCSSGDDFVLTCGDRVNGLPGKFQVVKCRNCGLMRTNPRPTPETMGYYYPDTYAPYHSTRIEMVEAPESNRGSARTLIKRWFKRWIKLHTDSTPPITPGRMLEVGCASGIFLHRMKSKGWTVEGIELSSTASALAESAGYTVTPTTIENAAEPHHRYDLVVGWMVLEHLHEPVAALAKLHSWTRSDGWLAVSVPNAVSFGARVFRDAWFHLHLPNHLYHYNRETLSKVLDAGGWTVERVRYQRDISDLIASFGNKLKDTGKFRRFADKLSTFPSWQGNLYLMLFPISYLLSVCGQTGAMTVWARRNDD